jgi:hypothetical protein
MRRMIERISLQQARSIVGNGDLMLDKRISDIGGCVRSELIRYLVSTWWSNDNHREKLTEKNVLRVIRRFIKPLCFDARRECDFFPNNELFEVDIASDLRSMLDYGDVIRVGEFGLAPSPSRIVSIPDTGISFLVSGLPTRLLPEELSCSVQNIGRIRAFTGGEAPAKFPRQSWEDFYRYSDWIMSDSAKSIVDKKLAATVAVPSTESLQLDVYDPGIKLGGRWHTMDSSEVDAHEFRLCRRINKVTNQVIYYLGKSKRGKFHLADVSHAEYRLLASWVDYDAGNVIQPDIKRADGFTLISFMRLPPDPIYWILELFSRYESTIRNKQFTTYIVPDKCLDFVSTYLRKSGQEIFKEK